MRLLIRILRHLIPYLSESMGSSQRMSRVQDPIIPHIGALIRATPGTISLGQGVVHYPPPDLARIKANAAWNDPRNHLYSSVDGIDPLKEKIAQKLATDNDIVMSPDRYLMVTAGGNMAFLNALLVITEPGDEVILTTPYYFNHEMAITMLGCRPVCVPVDDQYQLDLQRLADAITPRTRAIVTVSPNNPTGAVYPQESLEAVNLLCARHNLYHISDEAYEYFTYDCDHFSPGSLQSGVSHTISLFSLSKSYGFAGWRIGYMVTPKHLELALMKAQDTNLICPALISQHAAMGALEMGAAYPRSFLSDLDLVRRLVSDALSSISDRCHAPNPDGAFYFFLKIETSQSPLQLAEKLISKHRVALIPGTAFGMNRGCYLRIAYGALNKETVSEGISRLTEGLLASVT